VNDAPLTLAYSPCPNDTFIFAAWTNGMLPGRPQVEVVLDDVEALNEAALDARYALTKVSYGAIPSLIGNYRILRAGGALGRGCGPLIVSNTGGPASLAEIGPSTRVAIPGRMTTAYLLLRLALEREPETLELRFDRIVAAVAGGEADCGLIIHESRFTYQAAGLQRVADLGTWWEGATGRPIPLGAIVARRDVPLERAEEADAAIRASLAFAYGHWDEVAPYVRAHAAEMDEAVMRAHIALYVNEFTDDLGDAGIGAVEDLFLRATSAGLIRAGARPDFV
jgi:1,4-dihydroxy-6-naphthoate synthase